MPRPRTWKLVTVGLAGFLAGLVALDRLCPPDLSRYRARSSLVLDSRDEILRGYTTQDGMWRIGARVDDVSARYLELLQGYEDGRFAWHPGVDPLAAARAGAQWLTAGRVVSGGSTLTMQVARLLEPHPRTIVGKLFEMARALQLEARFSKAEILSMYLTLAPYGGNLEGVRAAALAYFGKEPRHLTDAQAALLIAIPQSPNRHRPDIDPATARAARDKVLRRLVERGRLTAAQGREASEEAVPLRRAAMPFMAVHLADRLARSAPAGAVVATHIDRGLQEAVESLAAREATWFDDGATIAVLVVENAGRRVRAYLGGTDFMAPAGQVDLARAVRSPGSTLKPFIYGFGLDDLAIQPETLIDDRPAHFGDYAPQNFDRDFHGTVTVRQALQQSLNLPAIALLDRVGPQRFAAALRTAGLTLVFPQRDPRPGLPLALGGVGMTLSDLTMAYAALADRGRVLPLAVQRGAPDDGAGERLISAAAAAQLTRILAASPLPDALVSGSIDRTHRWIAFKTGTSYGFRDAWALGYSARHTIGVWVGRADGTPRPGRYGRNVAAPLLFKLFDLLPAGEADALPGLPADAIAAVSTVDLPAGLRRFGSVRGVGGSADPLRIAFPPSGATVELPPDDSGQRPSLAVTAGGGRPPYRWLVNGRPIPSDRLRPTAFWSPDGAGYVEIRVIDQEGDSAHVDARIR
ncbi:MAG: penicillin-binding protein 1C [Proteobacteria bacterium]|nr:penicillin-binding protein 1C [Pseudomonadota bacterium]